MLIESLIRVIEAYKGTYRQALHTDGNEYWVHIKRVDAPEYVWIVVPRDKDVMKITAWFDEDQARAEWVSQDDPTDWQVFRIPARR